MNFRALPCILNLICLMQDRRRRLREMKGFRAPAESGTDLPLVVSNEKDALSLKMFLLVHFINYECVVAEEYHALTSTYLFMRVLPRV